MNYLLEADNIAIVEDYQAKIHFKKIENNDKNLKVLSLFSGCGGMDLGFRGGFEFRGKQYAKNPFSTILANDISNAAVATYESNNKYFGDHKIIASDIRAIPTDTIPT